MCYTPALWHKETRALKTQQQTRCTKWELDPIKDSHKPYSSNQIFKFTVLTQKNNPQTQEGKVGALKYNLNVLYAEKDTQTEVNQESSHLSTQQFQSHV